MPETQRRLRPLVLFVLAALVLPAVGSTPAADAAGKSRKQKTARIKHVGSVDAMPGSTVSFTLVKRGRKLVKATRVRITGLSLWCNDGGVRGYRSFTVEFPDMRILRESGLIGFGVEDIPMAEYEWGYKRIVASLSRRGMRASGDARIRFEDGQLGCGGVPITWTSRAQ